MDFKTLSKGELDELFANAQAKITELQVMQTEIAADRRRRRAEDALEVKRAELKALEESLSATG